ncbi:MAG TPA: hypothetical protein VEC08_03390, partial [Nitrososphaerales archaeon]|nr:hypothetical protein [Nitrososphaerales archaeon]
ENTEIIACTFCGTKQQRVDIEKYIAQLRADVYGWVRSIVPTASISVANVDPVARAQIFEQIVRGEVTGRMGSINAQMMRVASLPLFLPPYTRPFQSTTVGAAVDSKEMLGQAAKFQGLMPFAQSEDQNSFVDEAVAVSETLGYVSNVMRIYAEPGPRSYRTVSKNFEAAADSLAKDKSRSGASTRMKGLASLTEGTALLIEGDLSTAETKFAEADRALASAQGEVMRQPSTASWYAGIKAERGMVASLRQLSEAVRASRSFSPNHMESLAKFEVYVRNFEAAKSSASGVLVSGDRLEPETFKEMSTYFRDVSLAKAGNSSVYAIGAGGTWVGCWLADLSYSFETGALFMKKGQSVQERILVSGTFPTQAQFIGSQPQALVTDVFAVRSESSFTDRFMGREKTLTTGVGYHALGSVVKGSLPSGSPVVPPLSTRADAERMANIYLEKVRQRLQGKLRIGIPSVTQLVYVGGVISKGWLAVPGLPGSMYPYVGEEKTLVDYCV